MWQTLTLRTDASFAVSSRETLNRPGSHAYFSLRLPHRIYHGAKGAMLVYDITNKQSFDNIPKWLNELVSHVSPSTVIMLIGVP